MGRARALDGRDLGATLSERALAVAVVLQEPFLFPLSVAENIAYGRPDAGPEVEAAAGGQRGGVHRDCRGLRHGAGGAGATLRGEAAAAGDRAGVAERRADPDPGRADRALDTQTEAAILEALERLRRADDPRDRAPALDRARADRVVVLEAGALVELGTHETLLRAGGLYARFHQRHWAAAPRAAAGADA